MYLSELYSVCQTVNLIVLCYWWDFINLQLRTWKICDLMLTPVQLPPPPSFIILDTPYWFFLLIDFLNLIFTSDCVM